MTTVGAGICLGLIVLLVAQAFLVWRFGALLSAPPPPTLADDDCPRATVILCLRGLDPFLDRCVTAILEQDYPRFDVRIVVDHRDDPTLESVQRWLASHSFTNVRVELLEERRQTCSLKCSSLAQTIGRLAPDVEFIAQLDADTIPHRGWLRELATALADPAVGAATGNRWYAPAIANWGSLVRYLWNAAAVVQMCWYRIAWGGTLAVKTRVIREAGLLEFWSNALCEDTMLYSKLRQKGYRLSFVPSLMMVNRESCDLRSFTRWVTRQLLTARLYHPGWVPVVGHALMTTAVPIVAAAWAAWQFGQGVLGDANACLVCLGIYQLSLCPLIAWLERRMRMLVRHRGESLREWSPGLLFKMMAAVLLTQVVYSRAMLQALLLRRIEWRGVEYRVGGPWKIELIEYRPYVASQPTESLESL